MKRLPIILVLCLGLLHNTSLYGDTLDLPMYMEKLETLYDTWQNAAQMIHDKQYERALLLMQNHPRNDLSDKWWEKHESNTENIQYLIENKDFPFKTKSSGRFREALFYAGMESYQCAVEAFTNRINKGYSMSKYRLDTFIQCLILSGHYSGAITTLEKRMNLVDNDLQKPEFEEQISSLTGIPDKEKLTLTQMNEIFMDRTYRVSEEFQRKIFPVLLVWRLRIEEKQQSQKNKLLISFFDRSGDGLGKQLILTWNAERPEVNKEEAVKSILEMAHMAAKSGDYEKACNYWKDIEDKYPDTPAWCTAVYKTGQLLKDQSKYQAAITQYLKLLDTNLDTGESGHLPLNICRGYRSQAQWDIGDCYFAVCEYQKALDAYVTTQQLYPFQSTCGNANAQYEYEYAFYQGLCHEYLKNYDDAVHCYFEAAKISGGGLYSNSTVILRLVDLYERTGQVEVLKNILEQWEKEYRDTARDYLDEDELDRYKPTNQFLKILEIHDWAQNGQWTKLIDLLKMKGTVAGPEEGYARAGNWMAVESARLLSMYPEKVAPLLIASLKRQKNDVKWIYYALGRCGTTDAINLLKEKAITTKSYHDRATLIYSLYMGGSNGNRVLDELIQNPDYKLDVLIERVRSGKIGDSDKDIAFPDINSNVILPSTIPFREK